MKKHGLRILLTAVMILLLHSTAYAAAYLIPVGRVVGLELRQDTVTIAAFDDSFPNARQTGLQIGDEILKIDRTAIHSAEDVRRALASSGGSIDLTISRKGKEKQLHLQPEITPQGPRLGILLRQGITGIGTVTYYDPATGKFGTLGHGVTDSSGKAVPMVQGQIYAAQVADVVKGKPGHPGQLKGIPQPEDALGTLKANTSQGVFGSAPDAWDGEAIPVAAFSELQTGQAVIRSTVAGALPREYSVEILKIYPESRADGRNMLLRVTDPALLEATGGIVQGMSGSPIIQNGKLIGAVTHVLVNDPTTGYGIFIGNMLDAAA